MGYPIAEGLQSRLNEICDKRFPWMVFDRALVEKVASEHNLSEELINSLNEKQRSHIGQLVDVMLLDRPTEYTTFQMLAKTICGLAQKGHAIIMGRGGCIIFDLIINVKRNSIEEAIEIILSAVRIRKLV